MDTGPLDSDGLAEDEFLAAYDPSAYANTSVAVDAVIFSVSASPDLENYRKLDAQKLELLLVKRQAHPFLGMRSLPGGFVGPGEDTDQAVMRVIASKTGLEDLYLEQLSVFSDPGRDPRTRVISLAYIALIDRTRCRQATSARDSPAWFEVVQGPDALTLTSGDEKLGIPLGERDIKNGMNTSRSVVAGSGKALAFDHAHVLVFALERLKERIATTQIAFNLLPEKFTIAQLQALHETILGQKLLAANFRRKIDPIIEETGTFFSGKGNRPSREFRFKGK